MKHLDLKVDLRLDRHAFARTFFYALALVFCAHAFCFFNPTYSGQSVMVVAGKDAAHSAYLLPLYLRLRGAISAPLLVGMLSALFLSLSAALTGELLRIRSPFLSFALCAALAVNPGVTSVFAASLHIADAVFLAQLLCALAALLCARHPLGFLPAAALVCGACTLDAGAVSCFASLALLSLLPALAGSEAKPLARAIRMLCALALGFAAYACGFLLFVKLGRIGASSVGLIGGFSPLAPLRALLAPLTAYPRMNVLLRAALLLALIAGAAMLLPRLGLARGAGLAVSLLLLPLASNLTMRPSQFALSYAYLDVAVVALVSLLGAARKRLARGVCAALCVLALGGAVFANQVYLKKNLEYSATLSYMTRVLERTERTEGYAPGFTPVAFAGTPDASVLSAPHKGFEHVAALDAARSNFAITSAEEMIWYCWRVLGYPLNFVSMYEMEQLAQLDAVKAMPAFPAQGCCQMLDGTLVVKLSE